MAAAPSTSTSGGGASSGAAARAGGGKGKTEYLVTDRTKLKRLPQRGVFDKAAVHKILDEAFMCYCSFVTADGEPCIIPTLYARVGDELLLHGHMHAAMLERLRAGARLAINVTIVDGFVLARAAFHHSANYRSVVIYSKAEEIVDESAKEAASKLIVDSLIPGRVQNSRQATPAELKATAFFRVPITEASAKVRTGGPGDDKADMDKDIWAGVIPMQLVSQTPIPDPKLKDSVRMPDNVRGFSRVAHVKTLAEMKTLQEKHDKLERRLSLLPLVIAIVIGLLSMFFRPLMMQDREA